ncbi:alpha-crystallin B chain isoform X3 [Prorops nasuta]|uniref:alpha-crystallin B chain isoform X3 n=1 Tax=Prorops nasuta TaxID=863751 RepID=UPI0034CDC475
MSFHDSSPSSFHHQLVLRSNLSDTESVARQDQELSFLLYSIFQPFRAMHKFANLSINDDLYPHKHKTVLSSRTTTQQSTQNSSLSPQHDSHAWLDGLNSPLIQDEGDNKMLKLRFDVSQYKPEEIVVKTVDNKLLVNAKHEEKTESKSVYREYNREFLLPKGTNPESIKSSLSKDGVLTVEAPLPAIGAGEKLIPIAHQ